MAKIYMIMGKSSSGKDTIYSRIKADERLNLQTVVMYTTRPMRAGETDGVTYNFTDEKGLEEFESSGNIIERRDYNTVKGLWTYFTADDGQIDIKGEARYIVIGTLQAYERFGAYFGKEHIVPIYIEVDDVTRIKRALEREERQQQPQIAEMCRRYLADEKDFSEEALKAAGIDKRYRNDELESCIGQIISDIVSDL